MKTRAVLKKCGSENAMLLTQEFSGIVGCPLCIQGMTPTMQAMANVAQRLGQRKTKDPNSDDQA